MLNIGIDKNTELVYESNGSHGRGVWPSPIITPAAFVFLSKDEIKAHSFHDVMGYRFREDSFDPVTRIRRGRFYKAQDQQPKSWRLMRHPGNPHDFIARDIHGFQKELDSFNGQPIWHRYIKEQKELPVVLLGVDERYTVWTILDVETISTGEDLVTLKARSSFGILPSILENRISETFREKIKTSFIHFADEAHRSSPVSVIDRARDVATLVLLAYFDLTKDKAKDLGALIKKLEQEKLIIAASSANIIARLHARAKPAEQEKRDLLQISEQDADLAIKCVGKILCEIGFAEWR